MKKFNKKNLGTASLLVASGTMVFGGAFALMTDSYQEVETVTVENVAIDGSQGDIHLEEVGSDIPVTELTSGVIYDVVGTIDNTSTVATEVTASANALTSPEFGVVVGNPLPVEVPAGPSTIDVADFAITVTPTVSATDGNIVLDFTAAEDVTAP